MFYVSGFYKFKKVTNINKIKIDLQDYFNKNSIKGTLIISPEGINGTISAKKNSLNLTIDKVKKTFNFLNFDNLNLSTSKFQPFHKGKVKSKNEVVPMGIKVDKKKLKNYIEPSKWNKLIMNKNTLLIDARKPFEHHIGRFKNAINPQINNFREFPNYLKNLKKKKVKNIAMFCTGGIRCEKASTYLNVNGFKNVYQLKGGILNYLQKTKKKNSLWKGECYVFDNRVSLKHNLKTGNYSICSGCRKPILNKNKRSKKYEEGVSCPNCHDSLTTSQKERFRMRQKQINLAKKLGKKHIFQKEY